jgi:hypothetical protein
MPLQPAPHTASEARSAPQMREERVEQDALSWDPDTPGLIRIFAEGPEVARRKVDA